MYDKKITIYNLEAYKSKSKRYSPFEGNFHRLVTFFPLACGSEVEYPIEVTRNGYPC